MSQFKNLVFEGGSVKGIAYAGALQELQAQKHPTRHPSSDGHVAGAITAELVALGATGQNVREIVGGTKFRQLMGDSFCVIWDGT